MTEGIIIAIIGAIGGLAGNVLTGIFELIKTRMEKDASEIPPADAPPEKRVKARPKSKRGILAALVALILFTVPGAVIFRQYLTVKSSLPVYAILYDDGSLVFQHGNQPDISRLWKTRKETYQVDMENGYSFKDSQATTPWRSEREFIQKAVFMDVIQPKSTAYWFWECRNMKSVKGISRLKTGNVTSMRSMFYNCNSLEKMDVSGFNTASVKNMSVMFWGCGSLKELDVSGFNTASVKDMSYMFTNCHSLEELDVSGFNTKDVTNMSYMFFNCKNLATIYASNQFVTGQVEKSEYMFYDCVSLKVDNGTVFDANHIDKTYARIDGGSSNPGYFSAKN